MKLKIEHNLGEAIEALGGINRDIQRAERSAIRTTATWAKKQFQTRMIAATQAPGKVFKAFRTDSEDAWTDSYALVRSHAWLGLNPVKGAYLAPLIKDTKNSGKKKRDLKANESGVWAGKYWFADAFIATTKSGHTGIFKRSADKFMKSNPFKHALIEQTANIDIVGQPIGQQVASESGAELERRFKAKLTELNPHIY